MAQTVDYQALCNKLQILPTSKEGQLLRVVFARLPGGSVAISPEPPAVGVACFDLNTGQLKIQGRLTSGDVYALAHEIIHAADFTRPGPIKNFLDDWRQKPDNQRHYRPQPRVDIDDPCRMLAQGLSEINAHVVQAAPLFSGRGGAQIWGSDHSTRYTIDSPTLRVLDSVEAYFAFMGMHDPGAPKIELMEQKYNTSFSEMYNLHYISDEHVRAFLEDHVRLRTDIFAI